VRCVAGDRCCDDGRACRFTSAIASVKKKKKKKAAQSASTNDVDARSLIHVNRFHPAKYKREKLVEIVRHGPSVTPILPHNRRRVANNHKPVGVALPSVLNTGSHVQVHHRGTGRRSTVASDSLLLWRTDLTEVVSSCAGVQQ
jgi:hypothetical protein